MGQSVSINAVSAGAAGLNVKELEDVGYEKTLSSARFMKCIRARHRHGLVVVKVAMRPAPDFKLTKYAKAIRRERELLVDVPNALGYQRIVEGEQCGYLVRQYLHSSLYDRMSTRPFLDDIEKKWLAFQLLCGLRDCHSRNVYHGDIKTENILVTSWNWLYLTDFSSSFKKTYLPEDNPADFSYFFDISGRRTCYVAPERFLGAGEQDDGRGVTWAMDVFSVGCVIAELFVEAPIFSLSQLFKYRKGEYDPATTYLKKITDKDINELVTHMIQVEPESRYSAEEYLNFWRRKAFPEYFYSFLHQYMGFITDPSSGRAQVLPDSTNFGEADERLDRIYYDFDKISYLLGYENHKDSHRNQTANSQTEAVLPVQINIPNNRHAATSPVIRPRDDGTLIFLSLVVSSLRNTARAAARIRACDLMLAFGERITDEAKLDRVLPFLVVLLNDKSDSVKIAALRAMTQLLALVEIVSPVNAYVFSEYIRPRLQNMVHVSSSKAAPAVRAMYASCLASLAHTSLRILDMVQALRADGSIPTADPEAENEGATDATYQTLYDVARSDLVDHFESHTKALLTDPDSSVRRAFLGSVSSLCVFFGSSKANDVILSHLNTYLNENDWQFKCAFLRTIVGVSSFVGSSSLEEFILPLIIQALTDPEEFVTEKVISSFASMAELGLFQRSKSWEMVDIVARFTMHPNIWIREAAAHFISATASHLSIADNHCIILPLLRPYLKVVIEGFSETTILDALKKPLQRVVLDMAMVWSQKVERGIFWKHHQEQRIFSFSGPEQTLPIMSSKHLAPNVLRKVPKNEEDDQWLDKLRNLGMAREDEFKLVALKDYINRMAMRRAKDTLTGMPSNLQNMVKLQDLGMTPQTIFFENRNKQPRLQRRISHDSVQDSGTARRPHTIADALLDASTTIDDSLSQRRKLHVLSRKGKANAGHGTLPGFIDSRDYRAGSSNLASPLSSSPSTRVGSIDHSATMSTATRMGGRTQNRLSPNGDLESDGTETPTEVSNNPALRDRLRIRHKSSAISLLNRKDAQKTNPEISTDTTNAVGEMDGLLNQEDIESPMNDGNSKSLDSPYKQAHHTYDGTDPNVIKLLDNLASENYPVDELDFGPFVTPIGRRSSSRTELGEPEPPWRPQGIHVATFGEHTAAINRILPSPDHVFFITASEDGTVKVWDTLRLERNLVHRSRQTHVHSDGAQVKCITFVENTHTFISCASDGTIDVVKVDCSYVGDTTKYGKLRVKRSYKLPEGEHATWCEHFRYEGKSTLMVATNLSRLFALDLRTMTLQYALPSPLSHGNPTTFCLDRKRNWLLLGTSRGIITLYDLRFRLAVKSWGFVGHTPIHRITLHPFKGRGRWICVAGGTGFLDVTVWDVEKMQCREVFRAANDATPVPSSANAKDLIKPFQPYMITETNTISSPPVPPTDRSFRTLIAAADAPSEDRGETKHGYLITAGSDRKIRFWDLTRVDGSSVVSGLGANEAQPRFAATHPTTGLVFNIEKAGSSRTDGGGSGAGRGEKEKEKAKSRQRESRVVTMAKEQRVLLRNHLDAVTDVAVLEGSVGMVLSADRKGCVYVFQ